MCGRYTHLYTWKQVHDHLDLRFPKQLKLEPSYNVAPTQMSPIVRLDKDARGRELAIARWGLVPSWADDIAMGSRLINARADGVASKPSFRSAFKRHRCLVPVSGFYEWQVVKGSKVKQPWYIYPADDGIMCFAGLWEWNDKVADKPVESFTIITTDANDFMATMHDRMPVILQPEQFDAWLDPKPEAAELQAMLAPAPDGVLTAHKIGTRVNKPANNEPSVIDPVS